MTIDELKQRLQQPYDRTAWQALLREVFPRVDILAQPHVVFCAHEEVATFWALGSVELRDEKKLAIFEVQLSAQKKLQRNRVGLRNLVADKIDQETCHGVLVIFTGQDDDYRFTFVAKESEFNEDGEFVEHQTATKRFTYLLGPHETCTTAARRLLQLADRKERATLADVVEAFSVEKLNKEFFSQYKEHYANFVAHLLDGGIPQRVFGIPQIDDAKEQDKANKPVRDFAKRLLGRLVFLHFLQKKGWLGCPVGRNDWIEGDRDFVRNLFRSCPEKGKFFSRALAPLFFEALNRADRQNDLFAVTGTRVPYLNGGLFEHEHLPNDHQSLPVDKLDFPAVLFENLLEFFGQYNFTIDENDPDDHEVGIDPEMLGHIFENLLEDNKDKGAFYTPKAIVQYMCQQSLIHYLQQHLGAHEELERLVRFKDPGSPHDKNNWVWTNARSIKEVLDRVKICDPAIGSGAFPIGLLQEIYWIKLTLDWGLDPADTKLKIIQNSIYGVDIDAGAVEIARLRFWLALIVDEDEPRPLPNLDYKIMQGDSLLESFEGIPLDKLHHAETFQVVVHDKRGQVQLFADTPLFHQTDQGRAQEIVDLIQSYFSEVEPARKQELHREIDRFVLDHIDYNLKLAEEKYADELQLYKAEVERKLKLMKGWKPPKSTEKKMAALEDMLRAIAMKKGKLQELEDKAERPYFLWHLFFQDVFEQGGFDIVIGNPPYVRHEAIKALKPYLANEYRDFFCGTADLYTYFYSLGASLLKEDGILCFIAPNKFMRIGYGRNTRALLTSKMTPKVVLDFGDLPIFDATTYPSILLLQKNGVETPSNLSFLVTTFTNSVQLRRLEDSIDNLGFLMPVSALSQDGWNLERPEVLALMQKLNASGTALNEYVNGHFFRGLTTGLNEAFVIGGETRERLIAEDPKCATLIKPWLRGRDIKKWQSGSGLLYIICIASSANKSWPWSQESSESYARKIFQLTYPSIYRHLSSWETGLRQRDDQGRYWWELRSCSYYDDFGSTKIISTKISIRPTFCLDTTASYLGNTSYFLPVDSEPNYLLSLLNSSLFEFYARKTFAGKQNGYFEVQPEGLEKFPVPTTTAEQKAIIIDLAQKIIDKPNSQEVSRFEAEIDRLVYELYGLSKDEILIVEASRLFQPNPIDKKSILFSRIFPALVEETSYFSLAAVKRALAEADIELADDTLREYMSEAMKTGIVSDAGRGWYSRHTQPVILDPKPVAKIIREVKKAFPLLDFCCWSTVQFNPFAQHLIAQPTTFLYADGDALNSIVDTLRANGWDAWANPGSKHAEQFIRPGEKTVVLRPSIAKQPESKDHVAPLEKALVDFMVESARLQLMDAAEVQRIFDNALGSGLMQLSVLFGYAETKREKIESKELTH